MLSVSSIDPLTGTAENPTIIRLSPDPNIAYSNPPQKISVNFNYSNSTNDFVFIFLEANGFDIVTASYYYDADNDPLTNPGFKFKDGSGSHYAFRSSPGEISNLKLYMQQTDINGSYGSVVEQVNIPGHYLFVGDVDLSLSKALSMGAPAANKPFTYTVKVTNSGPYNAEDVVLTERLPRGVTYVGSNYPATVSKSGDETILTFKLGNIDKTSDEVTITVTPTLASKPQDSKTPWLLNTVSQVTAGKSAFETQSANNTVSASWVVGGKDCTTLAAHQFKSIMPGAKQANIQKYLQHLNNAMREFEINTNKRQQAFIAQLAHESAQLRASQENLNYSVEGLRNTFGKYFKTDKVAKKYARKPKKIANYVYANRNGNGDEASGDGWRYRGRGLIQLTGRANYRAVGQFLNVDLENNPDLALTPENSARIAAYFWYSKGLNQLADRGNFKKITRIINGGLNGYDDRLAYYNRAQQSIDCNSGVSRTASISQTRTLIADANYSSSITVPPQLMAINSLAGSNAYDISGQHSLFGNVSLANNALLAVL